MHYDIQYFHIVSIVTLATLDISTIYSLYL